MAWAILLVAPRHRLGVGVVLFNEKHQVLLLRHVFHPTFPWGLPGGWLNRHEDPAAGALRELWEETGLTAVLGSVILIQREMYPSHLAMAYFAYEPAGSLNLSNEIIEAAWIDLDDLPQLLPFTQIVIEKAVVMYDSWIETAAMPDSQKHEERE
jgi:ADP-ribose pyrophosphatase YjhB (NUDIX family)